MALILCIPSDFVLYLFKDYENLFARSKLIFILNSPKENNSERTGRVIVLVIYILSDEALYLFQVS